MKSITEALKQHFAQVETQQNVFNPLVVAKFFAPSHRTMWYVVAYYIDVVYITGLQHDEWRYFSN